MPFNTFVCADLHFGHKGMIQFLRPDGSKLRPFSTVEEHDEALISNWNSVVGPKDKCYILGDFCINRRALATAGRLNGDKVLIKGNHDVFRLDEYTPYFRDVRAYHVLGKQRIILSHIPIHTGELSRWRANIHGHLHHKVVMATDSLQEEFPGLWPDERYTCVSMEHIDYTPILLDRVVHLINGRIGEDS